MAGWRQSAEDGCLQPRKLRFQAQLPNTARPIPINLTWNVTLLAEEATLRTGPMTTTPANLDAVVSKGALTVRLNTGMSDFRRETVIIPASIEGTVTLRGLLTAIRTFYAQPITLGDIKEMRQYLVDEVEEYETEEHVDDQIDPLIQSLAEGKQLYRNDLLEGLAIQSCEFDSNGELSIVVY